MYLSILIVLFVLMGKFFLSKYKVMENLKNSYSWWEIMNPFNSAPREIYEKLSPENKAVFWNITSNIIVGIITCWMGFSVQLFVYESTQIEYSQLLHNQIVDKFRPMYMDLVNDSNSYVIFDKIHNAMGYGSAKNDRLELTPDDCKTIINGEMLSEEKQNTAKAQMIQFLCDENNWTKMNSAANKCIEISSSIAPYLDSKKRQTLLVNNASLLVNIHLYNALNDTAFIEMSNFIKKYYNSYIHASVMEQVAKKTNVFDLYKEVYSLYENFRKANNVGSSDLQEKTLILLRFLQFTMIPMWENVKMITDEFSAESPINPTFISVMILFVSLIIGYIIFRIVVMRIFDKKMLHPSPIMSKNEIEKINRELALCIKENKQYEINMDILSSKNKDLQLEIKKMESKCAELKEKLEKQSKVDERVEGV